MKKSNIFILYCIFFSVLALCSFVSAVMCNDILTMCILIFCGAISTFLLGICAVGAKAIYEHNKYLDLIADWEKVMREKENMQIKEKQSEPFEEFSIEYED